MNAPTTTEDAALIAENGLHQIATTGRTGSLIEWDQFSNAVLALIALSRCSKGEGEEAEGGEKTFLTPVIGKREAALNLALTEAQITLKQSKEYVFPWRGPSEGEMIDRIEAAIQKSSEAMALDFDKFDRVTIDQFHRRQTLAASPAPDQSADAHDRETSQLIDERDAAEEALSQAYYLVIGRSPEWSNLFGRTEALEEIEDACTLLRKSAVPDQDARLRQYEAAIERAAAILDGWIKWEADFCDTPKKHPWLEKARKSLTELRAVQGVKNV